MTILRTLLEITIYSAVLFGAIGLFRRAFKKHLSAAMLYAVWFLLIARLMMPVTISSGVSFFVIPADAAAPAQSVDLSELLGDGGDTASYMNDPAAMRTDTADEQPMTENDAAVSGITGDTAANTAWRAPWLQWAWGDVLIAVWLLGAGVSLVGFAVSTLRLKRRIKDNGMCVPAGWQRMADDIRADIGLARDVHIVMMPGFVSPALNVSLRPTIIMPAEMCDEAQVALTLRHELMHLRRRDHIVCLMLMALRIVYWFNPIVWLAVKTIKMDMETACDSMVVKDMNTAERKRYAGTILQLYAGAQERYVLGMALGNTKKTAERRLRGVFMRGRSSGKGRAVALMLAVVMLVACFTTACQPTPEEQIIIGKDQDEMLAAAQATPEAEGDDTPAFSLADMAVPDTYIFNTTGADGNLTVAVDAPVRLPDADMLPTAKVTAGRFTQEVVSGMLDYLYGDTPYYQEDNRLTKDDIQRIILENQQQLTIDGLSEDAKERIAQEIASYQQRLATAPDERDAPKLSDGTMIEDSEGYGQSIDVKSVDEDTGYRIASFTCSSPNDASAQPTMTHINDGFLSYSNYSSEDDEYYNYTMDGAQRVYSDEDIPDDLKDKLGVTLADAKALVQGLLDSAGVGDMACSAAFVIDDHGTGHVDDYSGVASDFAFKLFYTRSVNGVSVLPTSEFAQNGREEYDYTWIYESMQVIVTDGGIVDITWRSPCDMSEMVTENTQILDFDEAAKIFEQKILTFYEAQVEAYSYDSIDITIDSVDLGLLRIKQQNAEGQKAGLYVPVWAFSGVVEMTNTDIDGYTYVGYDHGCDFPDKPYIVLAVNAINGSIIDPAVGY